MHETTSRRYMETFSTQFRGKEKGLKNQYNSKNTPNDKEKKA